MYSELKAYNFALALFLRNNCETCKKKCKIKLYNVISLLLHLILFHAALCDHFPISYYFSGGPTFCVNFIQRTKEKKKWLISSSRCYPDQLRTIEIVAL